MVRLPCDARRCGACFEHHAVHAERHCPNWLGVMRSYSQSLFYVLVFLTCPFPIVPHGAQSGKILVPSVVEEHRGSPH
jgi:hypothetical protein